MRNVTDLRLLLPDKARAGAAIVYLSGQRKKRKKERKNRRRGEEGGRKEKGKSRGC